MSALIQRITESDAVAIATAAGALALPPGEFGIVPSWWNRDDGCISELELEVWADASLSLSAAELIGAMPHALVFADKTITTVTHGSDLFTLVAHGLQTGDGPALLITSLTFPAGSDGVTPYWAIKINDDTFKLATSLELALAGTPLAITGNGTGVIKLVDTADTQRLYWHSNGLLGPAGDGVIELTASRAYLARMPHSPRAVAYAMVATFGDVETCSASIYPLRDR
jgi:hypothetical protein